MKLITRISRYFLLIFLMMFSCRKFYDPPVIEGNNHFLAVNGFIYTGTAVTNMIALSRSLNLYDSVANRPELNAGVSIQSSAGDTYSLIDSTGTGIYQSAALNLDSTLQYRLNIVTSDGNKFQSDFVSVKQAPPIDSLTWELIGDPDPKTGKQAINIFVNAHDPNNATRYYRWDYTQTYKHFATYRTYLGVANGMIYPLPLDVSYYTCWSTVPSQNFALGSSVTLSQDVISHIPVAHILQNDRSLDVGCSFLFRQYPLTEIGYNYWVTVQKNSQSLGGLFDLTPADIKGNLHCVTNPDLPVFGFVSASTVQDKRIYISNKSLPSWQSDGVDPSNKYACLTSSFPVDPLNELVFTYPDTAFGPLTFATPDLVTYLVIAPKSCMDCRYQGGTNVQPSFWPPYD
jgi:Domain of unknown function (DUF4249)